MPRVLACGDAPFLIRRSCFAFEPDNMATSALDEQAQAKAHRTVTVDNSEERGDGREADRGG